MPQVNKRSTKLEREFYRELHNVADRGRGRVARNFLDAVGRFKSQVDFERLIQAVALNDARAVQQALGYEVLLNELQPMMSTLQGIYISAAVKAAEIELVSLAPGLSFDLVNPKSINFLRTYDFSLIQSINGSTKEGIRTIITNAFEHGGGAAEQARQIMDELGLTSRQAAAVRNFRATLEAEGVSPSVINRRANRFAQRQLRARAMLIARTETMRAANAGQRQMWNQAVDNNVLDIATTKKIWITTPDDRLCPICKPIPEMNEGGVPLNGTFNTPRGAISEPPIHPRCRCVSALVFEDE